MVSLLYAIVALPFILAYLGKKKARKAYLRKKITGQWKF